MSRYIDVDTFYARMKERIDKLYSGDEFGCKFGLIDVEVALSQTPTVDVEKHGHWTWKCTHKECLSYGGTIWIPMFVCSVCGRVYESYARYDEPGEEDADYPMYCENCGSRMDEVVE